MRRLSQIILVIVVVLALSTADKIYEWIEDGTDPYKLLSLVITGICLVYSVIWFWQVRTKSNRAKIMTLVFMSLPVIASIIQLVTFWEDKSDIIFNVIASAGMIVLIGIYIRLIMGWLKKLNKEFEQIAIKTKKTSNLDS